MGSATIRHFALVAALVLLAPIWCRPADVLPAAGSPGSALIGLAPAGGSSTPAIRRSAAVAWWLAGARPDHGLVGVGVAALLSLLTLIRWSPVASARSAPSPLVLRRHAIALRAPPSLLCT